MRPRSTRKFRFILTIAVVHRNHLFAYLVVVDFFVDGFNDFEPFAIKAVTFFGFMIDDTKYVRTSRLPSFARGRSQRLRAGNGPKV